MRVFFVPFSFLFFSSFPFFESFPFFFLHCFLSFSFSPLPLFSPSFPFELKPSTFRWGIRGALSAPLAGPEAKTQLKSMLIYYSFKNDSGEAKNVN